MCATEVYLFWKFESELNVLCSTAGGNEQIGRSADDLDQDATQERQVKLAVSRSDIQPWYHC